MGAVDGISMSLADMPHPQSLGIKVLTTTLAEEGMMRENMQSLSITKRVERVEQFILKLGMNGLMRERVIMRSILRERSQRKEMRGI